MTGKEEKPVFTWAEKRVALARHLRPFKTSIILLGITEVGMAVGNSLTPYVTGKFFDTLITPHTLTVPMVGTYPAWIILLFTWFVLQASINSVNVIADKKERRLTTRLQAEVTLTAYSHLLTLPISFYKKHRVGEITENINRAGWMLESIANLILSTVPQFLTIIIGIIIVFLIYPPLALILLVGITLYLLIIARILPQTALYQEEGMRAWNRTMGDAHDAYANFLTVKQAGTEEYENRKISDSFMNKTLPLWYRIEFVWSNLNQSQRMVVLLTQAAVLLYSVFLIGDGKITVGDLIAFNSYAGMIIGPFVRLGGQWQNLQNGLISLARAETIFQTAPEIYAPEGSTKQHVRGDVRFEHVRFSYEPDQPEILKDVSFSARAGEVVAFVGETGVGKSTSIDLISGYYFPTGGAVYIDDVDTRMVNLRDLRRQMAVVPQEVVLFNTSIKENIRYGCPDATDAMVKDAAVKAHADTFIEKFPEQYEQEVGERGVKLSVGQKQRIAIARAILRDPRILILDEPTSALDAETEQYISKSFDELMQGRTTFIVAHRLSTVRKADKILVIKDGVVAEEGRHDELIEKENGIYKHLYDLHIGLHE